MSNIKKLMSSAAGGGSLNVEDVFSTYLWTGDATAASSRNISNGIDLAGEGGLAWIKRRTATQEHTLYDSERSLVEHLSSDNANPSQSDSFDTGGHKMKTFNSDGFSVGYLLNLLYHDDYVSWTFRKAPKFFDIVTWTGDGTGARVIPHALGTVPGMYIAKTTAITDNWFTYHRSLGGVNNYVSLDSSQASQNNTNIWSAVEPTATHFSVGAGINISGRTYVTYLFAHNDGDGEFGPNGDADIIKCGSYTGNGSNGNNGTVVDLGFEPQWLMVKNASSSGDWVMVDTMRGFPGAYAFGSLYAEMLHANESTAEDPEEWFKVLPNGFQLTDSASNINSSGSNYIYMAIRRGTKVPESATEVFAIDTKTDDPRPAFISDFPVDMALWRRKHTTSNWSNSARLIQGKFLYTDNTNAEGSNDINAFDYQDGWYNDQGADNRIISWMWKRAPGFFDVVAYTGNGTGGRTISHNLGVAPEMMWVKPRSGSFMRGWTVYLGPLSTATNDVYAMLDTTAASGDAPVFYDTAPTDSVFTVSTDAQVNSSSNTYIAYLFATLPGISKVGSYTGNGTSQTIDCGFTSGARFVLIKKTSSVGYWSVFDTTRGLVAGNDKLLRLDTTDAELTAWDSLDPNSTGFSVQTSSADLNQNGEEYIFYAIA